MIINNLNATGRTYHALRSNGLVGSKAEFSKWYLAKSDSYLRSMQARSRTVPDATVAMLEWSLQREIINFSYNPHLGQTYAVALNAAYECLQRELSAVRHHREAMRQVSGHLPANNNEGKSPPADGPRPALAGTDSQISVVSEAKRL